MNKVTILEDWCKGCGLCVRACPKAVLAISTTHLNKKGYYPAEVANPEACIACAACARTCPDTAIEIEK
ncbi:MAG: 4Fe-4S binding protein [Lachnospiraceae bacterium]|jgi:2-oxoglutarate ferredoxin oxidoreductase subunit delta|nr:4Fe-4S binding protein [Lachnospiraceae bacterium]MBQ6075176.1 4Fe-4S binding protein [Lachnospiraceae bacterium]MBQ6241476.1 4Fe-4S binding protein [Lachnospiraceae bacterium]